MDTNKILSADFLDVVFDNRNKDYGAYELRRTYQRRVTKALIFTGLFVALTCTGVVLANKLDPKQKGKIDITTVSLENIDPEVKEPEPLPEPPQEEPPQTRTEPFTNIVVAPDDIADAQIPTQDDLDSAVIGTEKLDGPADMGVEQAATLTDGMTNGLIEEKEKEPTGPFERVEIDAIFDGSWEKFLLRNLNAQTPVDNNAPAGTYKVLVKFVVDVDGMVSDIKPLTNLGYGLEEEAIRVLKKAKKWIPAVQNGRHVKAYRIQAITFLVDSEE